ncbi:MAG: cysteine--tRNA ligase [Candidatus Heimdallarchaeota archaeon]|nr:cysteine--tRNA ligase [Candidatus Heimdallarchaeota archaeon]
MAHKVYLFNTLSRKKELFTPLNEDITTVYTCGQTVYEDVHVGNAKTYAVWDLLVRTLRHLGFDVKHVQNFTDVGHLTDDADAGEDKIIKKAKSLNTHPMELVDSQIEEYYEVMDEIKIQRPQIAPRATGHLIEMIDVIQNLIENEHAYEIDGSVYFDVSTFPSYGDLAKLDLDNLLVGVREDVKIISEKRNPADFALWIKAPPEHIMKYTSPWGIGYPGWHIECSAMAMKYLGETIDIHGGGIDHIPVHHTNEIAQSEGATKKKFVNYWLHSEFITINGDKMSKSKGNFVTLRQLIDEIGAGSTKYSLISNHYRTQADFSMKQAKSNKKRYNKILRVYHLSQQLLHYNTDYANVSDESTEFLTKFNEALADDLNTPKAFAQLNALVSKMDILRKEQNTAQLSNFMNTLDIMINVFGLPFYKLSHDEIEETQSIVNFRLSLREKGDFEGSDLIRKHLNFNGYTLEDQSETETLWYKPNFKN